MTINLLRRVFMVVDDLDPMRAVTINQLRSLGCDKILSVRGGEEALRRLRSQRVDAVVASWNMEGMSGLDLLRAVRADPKLVDLPFLMITAEAERHHVQEIILAGVNSLLVKPYSVGGLSTRLEKMLGDADRAAEQASLRRHQASEAASTQQAMRDEIHAIGRQAMAATLADVMAQLQGLAQEADLAPRHAEQIRHAGLSAQQALDWVALADELQHLESGRVSAALHPVDLGALLRGVVEQARQTYANKSLQLVVDVDTPVGTEVPLAEVDETLCQTLFQLWLRIACDATPAHGRVLLTLQDRQPLRVLVDYPVPLSAQQAASYFTSTLVHKSLAGSATTGPDAAPDAVPGAYVAQRLTRLLGGSAAVQAVEGGAQVVVTLPRHAFSPPPAEVELSQNASK